MSDDLKIENLAFELTDWGKVEAAEHPGETGGES
jgi:hypothetical protein